MSITSPFVNTNYTAPYNSKRCSLDEHLFQEIFYSTPLDEVHFLHALKYVEQNPVKAYMVDYPWEYKYSSAKYRLNLVREDNLLSSYEPTDAIENYKEFLQENAQIKLIKEKQGEENPAEMIIFMIK